MIIENLVQRNIKTVVNTLRNKKPGDKANIEWLHNMFTFDLFEPTKQEIKKYKHVIFNINLEYQTAKSKGCILDSPNTFTTMTNQDVLNLFK